MIARLSLCLVLALLPGVLRAEAAFLGAYHWQSDDPALGGVSAIAVLPGGSAFIALSDRGQITTGQMLRDAEGRITAVQAAPFEPLHSAEPLPWKGIDSEGLAVGADGTIHLSVEGLHRLGRVERPGNLITWLPGHPDFTALPHNASFEALAIAADGALYTLPEKPVDGVFPVYRFHDGAWQQPFSLRSDAGWLAVGADFGPDGQLYLLERGFNMFLGFRSRVRQITLTPHGGIEDRVVLETAYRTHDNLEGISVWRDGDGAIRLTLVADNNFMPFQRTEIVEYRLNEVLDPARAQE